MNRQEREFKAKAEKYNRVNRQVSSLSGSGSAVSSGIVQDMEERIRIIVNADTEFSQIAGTNQRSAIKGGFAAETAHKESFNLDAISKKKTVRAYNDNDFEFFQQGFKKNDPSVDIVTVKGDEISQKAQVKYYQDGKTTANALREQRPDGSAKYHETDQHIVPGDQVNDVQDAARRTSQKELQNRPKVAAAADEVERKSTGRLRDDGVASASISKKESLELSKKDGANRSIARKQYHRQTENQTIARNSVNAMKSAAVTSSVIAGTVNSIIYLRQAASGELNADEAVVKIAANTACTAADATVKAGAVTAVLGKTAARGLIKNGVKGLLGKNAISGTVAASVDFAKDLVLAAQGKLEAREVAGRAAKTGLQVAAGGAAFEIGRSLAVALGASGAFLPIGAGLACSIVIASALNLAIEVGIERPFRELMINTENLYDSLICLDQAARDMGLGQQMFGQFLEENLRLDQNLKTVMKQNRQLSDKMWDAVSAI